MSRSISGKHSKELRMLLLGGSSFVGGAVRALPGWPQDARWTFRTGKANHPQAIRLDLSNSQDVHDLLQKLAPTHVLDCSLPGRNDPSEAERTAQKVCASLVSANPQVRYLLVSSDAVFSGEAGRPYSERDQIDPGSDYGRAKAAVEATVTGMIEDSCVARTCLVYGRDYRLSPPGSDPRLAPSLEQLRQGQKVHAYSDQYRTPTALADLAPALLRLLLGVERGIFHLAGPIRCSRADFLRSAARAFSLDPALVLDEPMPPQAMFGRDTSLSCDRAREELGWAPRTPEQGLLEMARQQRESGQR